LAGSERELLDLWVEREFHSPEWFGGDGFAVAGVSGEVDAVEERRVADLAVLVGDRRVEGVGVAGQAEQVFEVGFGVARPRRLSPKAGAIRLRLGTWRWSGGNHLP
jgi:hypothetical protein